MLHLISPHTLYFLVGGLAFNSGGNLRAQHWLARASHKQVCLFPPSALFPVPGERKEGGGASMLPWGRQTHIGAT